MQSTSLNLKYWPEDILSKRLEEYEVTPENLPEFVSAAEQMNEIMRANRGYGLAANQVGYEKRLFVMIDPDDRENASKFLAFINPVITNIGGDTNVDSEGCLSFPGKRISIVRRSSIDVSFTNLQGEELTWHFEKLNARCVQHEVDHLNGIMIFDHLQSNLVRKMTIEKYFKNRKKYVRL